MSRVLLATILLLGSCSREPHSATVQAAAPPNGMKISSSAFADGGEIPAKFGCSGSSVSPPLSFAGVPANAKSLALIVEDPDAPGGLFTHWVVWNMTPAVSSIPEGASPSGVQGNSGYGKAGYGPPCPPNGEHRYVFRLFALDATLSLPAGSGREQLIESMKGHVIAEARVVGRYRK